MPAFRYTAYDIDGREQKGVLEADSARLARGRLREQALFPLEVALIESDAAAHAASRARLSAGALSRITRQLATLIGAGLTIEQSLNALVEQAEDEAERQVLAGVRASVLEGQALSAALTRYPKSFSDLYRTLVEAGETSGKLPDVLLRLADHVESAQALRQRLGVAMIYPLIVLGISLLVVGALMLYVVPQVVGVFESTRQTLPFLTRALLALSAFLKATGIYWIVVLGLAAIGARIALRDGATRRRFHESLLRLPILGRLIRSQQSAQLAATLSILVGSGVPVLQALHAGVGVVSNLPMRLAVERAANAVREGAPLARSLGSSGRFPPVLIHLIESGETSGRLAQTLSSAAGQQQRDVETRVGALAAVLEPLMIVAMGVTVLLIVLAVLMPIFELNQLVR